MAGTGRIEVAGNEPALTLEARKISKRYGNRWVVREVSFQVGPGQIVGLLGPNGAGKTTSFYAVVGLIRVDAGDVLLDGEKITHVPMYRRARRGIVYLPQEPSVFRRLRVRENIEAILEMQGWNGRNRRRRLARILEELGLEKVADSPAYALSGGERRRVEIGRALAMEPRFLLLDEPFTGIDPIAVKEIQQILQVLKQKNMGVLITDHNVRETLKITDHAFIINDGRILSYGTPGEVAADPTVRQVYLGEDFQIA